MTLKQKQQRLFEYIIQNGVEFSMTKISETFNISNRTLYYRYHSKKELVLEVKKYGQEKWRHGYLLRSENCNNAVEKLVIFITCLNETKDLEFLLIDEDFFISILRWIVEDGISEGYFNKVDVDVFVSLLLFNLIHFFIRQKRALSGVSYILKSLLSEEGGSAYNEINGLFYLQKLEETIID